jgi:hypothetical protein
MRLKIHIGLKFRCFMIGHMNPRCFKALTMWNLFPLELFVSNRGAITVC